MRLKITLFISLLFQLFLVIRVTNPTLPLTPLTILLVFGSVNLSMNRKYITLGIPFKISLVFFTYILIKVIADYFKTDEFPGVASMIGHLAVVVYLMNCALLVQEKHTKILLRSFFIVSLISLAYGLLVFFIGTPFSEIRMLLFEQEIPRNLSNLNPIYSSKSTPITGLSSTVFAFSYVISALFVFSLYYLEKNRNLWFFLLFILVTVGLLLNGERAGFVAALLAGYLFIKKKVSFKLVFLISIFFILIFLITSNISFKSENHQSSFARLINTSISEEPDDFIPRIKRQVAGFITVLQNPVFGATQSEYLSVKSFHFSEDDFTKVASHNAYINVGIHTGLFGWILLLLLFSYIIQMMRWIKINSDFLTLEQPAILKLLSFSLLAPLLNAFFHNAGILNSCEPASIVILGILIQNFSSNVHKMIDSGEPPFSQLS